MNELHIKSLEEAIGNVREATETFMEYCTDRCKKCPISKACDWQGNIDFLDSDLTHDVLNDYVDYFRKVEDEEERKNFYETTGVDPSWYDYNEDRSETWED
jgi:hypothetical protein